MMAAHGDRVCLDELRAQMTPAGRAELERLQMKEPEGIGGWNPLMHASADLGREIIAFCAERIGRRAEDALSGRFIPGVEPGGDFMDNPGPTD